VKHLGGWGPSLPSKLRRRKPAITSPNAATAAACYPLTIQDFAPITPAPAFVPPADPNGYAAINDDTAAELMANIKDFKTPASVNLFLGNLVTQVVRKRVGRRDAITLAYLSQLLLNSVSSMGRDLARERESQPKVIVMDGIFSKAFEEERMRKHAEQMAARVDKPL
jgi:hypothetical protein